MNIDEAIQHLEKSAAASASGAHVWSQRDRLAIRFFVRHFQRTCESLAFLTDEVEKLEQERIRERDRP